MENKSRLGPYKFCNASVKQFGKHFKVLTCCYVSSYSKRPEMRQFSKKGSVNTQKLRNNLSRTKSRIRELALCNDWDWFVTLTLDPQKFNRYDLKQAKESIYRFIRDYKKKTHQEDIKYLLIPEHHKDGAWHFHGLLHGISVDSFRAFSLEEKLPNRIRSELLKGNIVYDWTPYREKFGYCSISATRNTHALAGYLTKYISKDFLSRQSELSAHLYFASKGLKSAEILKKGFLATEYLRLITWDFENDYVLKKNFKISDQPELLFTSNRNLSDSQLHQKESLLLELVPWQYQCDQDTGEILFDTPFSPKDQS